MGLYSNAHLLFGVRIKAVDDDYEPTMWWNADDEDWVDIPPNDHFELSAHGHYESDEPKAIIRLKCTEEFSGDCWDPTEVPIEKMNGFWLRVHEAQDEFARLFPAADISLLDSKWWLVASYG